MNTQLRACWRPTARLALLAAYLLGACCGEGGGSSPDRDAGATPAPIDAEAVAREVQRTTAELPAPTPRPPEFRRGVSLGLFVSAEDTEERRRIYGELLDEIVAVGATDVQLVVRWAQADIHANTIGRSAVTVDDDEVRLVAAEIHRRGLRVFLLPILHLDRMGRGEWRGTLRPADPEAWWTSYTAFILHYAHLAAESRIELLSVGSELVSTEIQQERWRAVIAEVRKVYPGALTYSANWDHFEPVEFWDALDVVGVTAYQELSAEPDPAEALLVEGWGPFIARLRSWARLQGRRYIFTEVGYPSHELGARYPWDYRPRGAPDPELQLRCYRALYRVWQDDPALDGLFLWNWFGFKSLEDRGYSPRGKPAEHVLRFWYRGSVVR